MGRDAWRPIWTVLSIVALVRALIFFVILLAIAIACLAIDALAGRLIGVAMIVGLVIWAWRGLLPWLRHPA